MASAMQGITYEDRLNLPLDKIIERNREKTKKAQKKARNNAFNANRQIGEKKNKGDKGEKKPKGEKKNKKPQQQQQQQSANTNGNANGATPGKKKFNKGAKRPPRTTASSSSTTKTTFRRRPRPTAPVSKSRPNNNNKTNNTNKQPRLDLANPPSITISIVNDLAFERKPKPPAAHRAPIRSAHNFPSHRMETTESFVGQSNSTTLSQRFSRF